MPVLQTLENEKIVLGKITTVHGVRGWVKVYSWTQPMENIFHYSKWWLRYPNGNEEEVVIEKTRSQGNGLAVLIKDCNDRDQARAYVNAEILVRKDILPELGADEYYWYQLEGMTVVASGNNDLRINLGRVHHMMDTGANDVMVVRPAPESIDDRERLIPWIEGEVVLDVDPELNTIQVKWEPDF